MAVGSLIYRIEYSDHSSLNGKRGRLVILRRRRKRVAKAAAKIDADWLWVQSAVDKNKWSPRGHAAMERVMDTFS